MNKKKEVTVKLTLGQKVRVLNDALDALAKEPILACLISFEHKKFLVIIKK